MGLEGYSTRSQKVTILPGALVASKVAIKVCLSFFLVVDILYQFRFFVADGPQRVLQPTQAPVWPLESDYIDNYNHFEASFLHYSVHQRALFKCLS